MVCILVVTRSHHLQKFGRQKGIGGSSYGIFQSLSLPQYLIQWQNSVNNNNGNYQPGTWYITSVSTLVVVASSNKFGPVQCAWQIDSMRNSVACHITSNLDFDKGGHVIQIQWTKALCDNCQPMLKIIVYRSQRSVSEIHEADSCIQDLTSNTV